MFNFQINRAPIFKQCAADLVDKSQRTSFIISYSLSTDDDVTSTIHSDFSKSSQFAVVKSFIAASRASLTRII